MDYPTAKQFGRILGDMLRGQNFDVAAKVHAFFDGKFSILTPVLVNAGERHQETRWSNRISANKNSRRHALFGPDKIEHILCGVTERRPGQMGQRRRRERRTIGSQESFRRQRKAGRFAIEQFVDRDGQQFELVGNRIRAVLDDLKVDTGNALGSESLGERG